MFALHKKSYGILQIVPTFDMGGVEQGTLDLGCFLKVQGHRSFILTTGGAKIARAQAAGVTILNLPVSSKNPFQLAKNVSLIKALCQEHHIHLIHARSRAPAWSALGTARLLGLPFVTTFHGTYNFSNAFKQYYNSIMVRGNRVIAISDFIYQHILSYYKKWVNKDHLRLIHRGVDLNYFDPHQIDKEREEKLRQMWQIPLHEPILLMPGRLTRWKGQEAVIKMLPYVSKGTVVFLGSDQGRHHYARHLEKLALSMGVSHRIRFMERCSHMREAYGLAQVVLHASTDPEAFGRVIAEAQAMGKPVLVSAQGAGKEIVLNQTTGWVIDPHDPFQMAQVCENILALTDDQLESLALCARQRMESRFSLSLMMEKTLQVYDELLSKRPPSP